MSRAVRPIPNRIGISALNILSPGLGLLRIGRGTLAAICLLAPAIALAALTGFNAFGPTLTFTSYAISTGSVVLVILANLLGSIILSWRGSRMMQESRPWFSRWYVIAIIAVVILTLASPLGQLGKRFYKPFYSPAESMAPTLLRGDRFLASLSGPGVLRRGDVVVISVGGTVYVKRVAALAGDRIGLTSGVVMLNGRPIPQRFLRSEMTMGSSGPVQARRLQEQLPGEARAHELYDLGPTFNDDFAPVVVKAGHIFVLGDNRDASADSRVPREQWGVEQVPLGDVRGKVLFYTWGPSGRTGETISH